MIVDLSIRQFNSALNKGAVVQSRDAWGKMFLNFPGNKNKTILYKEYETQNLAAKDIGNVPTNSYYYDMPILKDKNSEL